jgi:hypothetical protein
MESVAMKGARPPGATNPTLLSVGERGVRLHWAPGGETGELALRVLRRLTSTLETHLLPLLDTCVTRK